MASTFDFSTVDASVSSTSNAYTATNKTAAAASPQDQTDRFLKLLVTQMQNQDPLNPMDNAQLTSQMAQISTVSGIGDLNKSITSMSAMLLQSQGLEAASLVGKQVMVEGKNLTLNDTGVTGAGFDLAGPADSVTVNIKNATGKVIDSINLGAESSGKSSFQWTSPDPKATGLTFEVVAKANGVAVAATPLVGGTVQAVYADGGQLSLELSNGTVVKYSDVKGLF